MEIAEIAATRGLVHGEIHSYLITIGDLTCESSCKRDAPCRVELGRQVHLKLARY